MGLQEYIVSKKNHKIEEFIEIIGINDITCVTIPKKDIKGNVHDIKVDMDKGEEYVVVYGDRYDLRDLLNEHFSDEIFFSAECANEIVSGKLFLSPEEMQEIFVDIPIDDYMKNPKIATNIHCVLLLPGKDAVNTCITAVTRSFVGESYPFRAIIDDNSYSLEHIWINDVKLTDFNNDESGYLEEWLCAMEYKHVNGTTKCLFAENGQEYCYYPVDFKRHYTCEEG